MPLNLTAHDSVAFFKDPEAQAELLADAVEQQHAGYLAYAIGIIARARGVAFFERANLSPEAFQEAFVAGRNPDLETFLRAIDSLDLELRIVPRTSG